VSVSAFLEERSVFAKMSSLDALAIASIEPIAWYSVFASCLLILGMDVTNLMKMFVSCTVRFLSTLSLEATFCCLHTEAQVSNLISQSLKKP
jgi:hypothetical protein